MRKTALTGPVSINPASNHEVFKPAHRFFFGNARICHTVQLPIEQRLLVPCVQIPIIRHAFVVVVGEKIEYILLQIGTGAADCVYLVPANHLCK